MKGSFSRLRTAAAVAALGLLAAGAPARAAVSYEDYHRLAEVERQLRSWSGSHPEVKLLDIGKSAGGRTIWVAQVAAAGSIPPESRPAVFVGANLAGWHNAGTEAALHLVERLLSADEKLLRERTFYIAPALNPDAHDGLFATPRVRRSGNGSRIDRDRDGFEGEDSADDLNGDGAISRLRIPDPAGGWLPDPGEPRLMIRADGMKERPGAFRIETEGRDDDRDGSYNEDGSEGVWPDRNFAHAFPYPDPEAGPWPSYAPESKAVMDFLLGRRNVALAVVYGPANNLLAMPQSLGGGGDLGTQKFKVPEQPARQMGLDPEEEYTLDQVWEAAQNLPFVKANNITKEQLGQFLGAGAATRVDPADQAYLEKAAEAYKERLKKAGLSSDRPAAQYAKGGLTPWLYYQYGAMALELDVWGIPRAEKKAQAGSDALTLDKVAALGKDEFLALGEEKIAAFLAENKVPAQFSAQRVMEIMKAGQMDPKAMVERIRQMGGGSAAGGGGDKGDSGNERERDVLAWVEQNAPGAFAPWKPVTLPDGTRAEVGGLDPFVEIAPPMAVLKPALEAHTDTVLDLAGKLARLEVVSLEATPLGGGVWRVRAVAGNGGWLATHTKMDERGRYHRPVRLALETGQGVELITGLPAVASERLDGTAGRIEAEWLVRAEPGTRIVVRAISDNAGRDEKTITLGKGA